MKLFVERIHRYRDMTQVPSSFGPGVFCNYDVAVLFEPASMPGMYSPYTVELFDPRDIDPKFLPEQTTGIPPGGTPTGVYLDVNSNRLNNLQCYDANGNLVIDPTTAATAVLTNWPGNKYTFGMINLGGYASNPTALWHFDDGSGTSAADSSGNGNVGTLQNSPTWITGQVNGALQFNGTNQYVSIGNPADLNIQGNITLAGWVNLQSSSGMGAAIISHGTCNADGMNTSPSVFLQMMGGDMAVGCVDATNTMYLAGSMVSGSGWTHWAGTYDGTNWNLYMNGQLMTSTASTVGAVSVNDNWSIAADGGGTQNFFNGSLDEVHVFNRALSPLEISVLASPTYLASRLQSITDRNGYQVTITRPTFTMQQINQAPDLQFQIDTVTDPYGRVATFHYLPTQVSGRWVVSEIDFPNGHKALYAYANGWLSTVTFDDGTQSTLTYGTDSTSQTSTVQFHDVAADGIHRNKTVYLTNNMVHMYYSGSPEPVVNQEQVANQASLMVRMVANGAGEVTFLGLCSPYTGTTFPNLYNIYEGAGRMKQIQYHTAAPFFLDGWTVGDPTQGFNAVTGTLETTSAAISDATTGEFPYFTDPAGHQFNYTYDPAAYPTQKTSNDNTLVETWAYNGFKQVTRHQDRNLNVTLNTYDAQGNLLSREVGVKNVGGVDTPQPEYGNYQWTYYPTGDPRASAH